MPGNIKNVRANLSRLRALQTFLESQPYSGVQKEVYGDFADAIQRLGVDLDQNISFLHENVPTSGGEVNTKVLLLRVNQAISFLTLRFSSELGAEQTTAIIDSLNDKTLRERCSDLLLADSQFDRAVNLATQALEERIRSKVGAQAIQDLEARIGKSATGATLVNELIKSETARSTIIFSSDDGEQRGFADIFRGIMAAHRNPTHHFIIDMTRIDAVRICSYIDLLLELIDNAQINSP